jgi:hypothetical protein
MLGMGSRIIFIRMRIVTCDSSVTGARFQVLMGASMKMIFLWDVDRLAYLVVSLSTTPHKLVHPSRYNYES